MSNEAKAKDESKEEDKNKSAGADFQGAADPQPGTLNESKEEDKNTRLAGADFQAQQKGLQDAPDLKNQLAADPRVAPNRGSDTKGSTGRPSVPPSGKRAESRPAVRGLAKDDLEGYQHQLAQLQAAFLDTKNAQLAEAAAKLDEAMTWIRSVKPGKDEE